MLLDFLKPDQYQQVHLLEFESQTIEFCMLKRDQNDLALVLKPETKS
jgi:hypothetical protein